MDELLLMLPFGPAATSMSTMELLFSKGKDVTSPPMVLSQPLTHLSSVVLNYVSPTYCNLTHTNPGVDS